MLAAYLFGQLILSRFLYFEPLPISLFFMGLGSLLIVLLVARRLVRDKGVSPAGLGFSPVTYPWYGAGLLGVLAAHFFAGLFWLGLSPEGRDQITNYNADLLPVAGGLEPLFCFLAVCFIYPLLEETLFRGALQTYSVERFGQLPGLFSSALLFGLAHTGTIDALGKLADQLLVVLSLSTVGFVAGLLRACSGSLYPAIFMHAGYNALLFL